MQRRPRHRWALYILGPGLFSAAAGFEVSNLGVFALAGMRHGTSVLWAVVLSLLSVSAAQQMAAVVGLRLGKEGLVAAINGRSRILASATVWSLYAGNIATASMNLAGLAALLSVFTGADWRICLGLVFLALWSISFSARSYGSLEKTLLALTAGLLVFIPAALRTSMGELGSVIGGMRLGAEGTLEPALLAAVFGAAAAPYSLALQAEGTAAARRGGTEILNVAVGTVFSIIIGSSIVIASPALAGGCGDVSCLVDPGSAGLLNASLIMVGVLASGLLALMAIIAVNSTLTGSSLGRVVGTPGYLASSGFTLGASYLAALISLTAWGLGRTVESASIVVGATAWIPALAVYLLYGEKAGKTGRVLGALAIVPMVLVDAYLLASQLP